MFKSVLAGPIIYGNLSGKELKKNKQQLPIKFFGGDQVKDTEIYY